ncbi:MAG: hypothetical protein UC961_07795 [Emergencia sp.]|nr:hypothetical protein [Emergencia sp.]
MYLIGSMLVMFIILLGLIFGIGLPVLAAVLVYKDAKKRVDCSPWLWALVAGLVPCFIGVVVYLIIRKDYPLKAEYGYNRYNAGSGGENCAGRNGQYEAQYDEQQYRSSEEEDNGAQYSSAYSQAPQQKAGMPTWGKVLLIIGGVVAVICLIALAVSAVQAVFSYISADPFSGSYNYHYDF